MGMFSLRTAALAAAIVAATPALAADPVEAFYKGKQLTFYVSTEPGTPYDAYARTLAQFLPNHIPGKPTIVIQNMVGAGGIRATNHVANVAPPAMPTDRLAALRRAFDQTMKDPAFLSDLAQVQLEVDGPMTGEEMAALIAQEISTPPEVLKLIEDTIAKYRRPN